jgi:nucleotide-binding universal stress UspA family protein
MGAKVHLLHVAPVPSIPDVYKAYATLENSNPDKYKAVGRAVLTKLEEVAKKAGVEFESDLEYGNPGAKIAEYSGRNGVVAVVVGLRGLHGIGRIRSLGSVARRVAENSVAPVVVVPT